MVHLDALSSFALLDSKILDPPDDPDDIFGFGENYKEEAFGNEFEIIGCKFFGVLHIVMVDNTPTILSFRSQNVDILPEK